MGNRVHGHDGIAAFLRPAREEAAHERSLRIIDPLVLVADHVVDGVLAPAAFAFFGGTGRSKKRAVLCLNESEPRVRMPQRRIFVQKLRGVRRSVHVAYARAVLASIRVLGLPLTAASELPLFVGAQALFARSQASAATRPFT